ncbi:hypothetical protein A3Q56_08563 [Intoshia linei]|uniref:Uncharacterized protein n=1 Tax=Intoshia linei TaxID=1819745 RepID=A0A177AQP7_9BILA|nr:hypothetical protein A3Q56_08563 [Intoshia linei]
MESILNAEKILYNLCSSRSFISGMLKQKVGKTNIKLFICSKDFIHNLKKSLEILEMIDKQLIKFQNDKVPISDVFYTFKFANVENVKLLKKINNEEKDYLLYLNDKKFEFMCGEAHRMGFLLDPRYVKESK